MSEAVPNGVTYTVKELLAKIEGKLDGVIITIGQKADKHDVDTLGDRVKALEEFLNEIDAAKHTAEEVAASLARKEIADRTWWERQRSKFAWGIGLLMAAGQIHQSFPHLHP